MLKCSTHLSYLLNDKTSPKLNNAQQPINWRLTQLYLHHKHNPDEVTSTSKTKLESQKVKIINNLLPTLYQQRIHYPHLYYDRCSNIDCATCTASDLNNNSHVLVCLHNNHVIRPKLHLLRDKLIYIITTYSTRPVSTDDITRHIARAQILDLSDIENSISYYLLSQLIPSALESFFSVYLSTNKAITKAVLEYTVFIYNELWIPIWRLHTEALAAFHARYAITARMKKNKPRQLRHHTSRSNNSNESFADSKNSHKVLQYLPYLRHDTSKPITHDHNITVWYIDI